ncbi:hypothetical protein PO124_18120 [Bacillus licheniformis]|nr:hypothetical protein [Bacillus licheniformis]
MDGVLQQSFVATAGHVVVSAFMTGAFIIATIAAYKCSETAAMIESTPFIGKRCCSG